MSELCGRRAGKFLSFFLGQEEYGLEIREVQEIIGMMDITPIPSAPPHVRGVVNLRGKVIPVVCLRARFGLEAIERTAQTCIIVVQGNQGLVGLVVDRVSEVLNVGESDIEDAPDFGHDRSPGFLLGVGKAEGRIRLLLDLDRVLGPDVTALAAQPGEPAV